MVDLCTPATAFRRCGQRKQLCALCLWRLPSWKRTTWQTWDSDLHWLNQDLFKIFSSCYELFKHVPSIFQTCLNLRIRPTDDSWHFESSQGFASALARWSLAFRAILSWLRLRPHQSRKWKSMLLSVSALSRRGIDDKGHLRSNDVTIKVKL